MKLNLRNIKKLIVAASYHITWIFVIYPIPLTHDTQNSKRYNRVKLKIVKG